MKLRISLTSAIISIALLSSVADGQEQRQFYVTVDGRNPLTFGDYTGLENPNLGKLTLLYAHWNQENPAINHFHSIGSFAYEGPIESPTVVGTNTNNRIPEYFTGQAPLTLQAGARELAGKLVSTPSDEHYSDIALHSIHELQAAAADTPEAIMYGSSGGGYSSTSMDGMNLAIELVSMTPGLYLGLGQLSQPGTQLAIGSEGDLPFRPIFWTNEDADPGTYSAEFKLIDLSGTYASSGPMNFDFAVVPEPSTYGLLTLTGIFALGFVRRRESN